MIINNSNLWFYSTQWCISFVACCYNWLQIACRCDWKNCPCLCGRPVIDEGCHLTISNKSDKSHLLLSANQGTPCSLDCFPSCIGHLPDPSNVLLLSSFVHTLNSYPSSAPLSHPQVLISNQTFGEKTYCMKKKSHGTALMRARCFS